MLIYFVHYKSSVVMITEGVKVLVLVSEVDKLQLNPLPGR